MLFPNLTVAQNVAAGISKDVSPADRDAMVQTELKRFGLSGFEKRYPVQLSGGQQQRVALARMLAARPGILMLDEPFSALDAHLKSVLEQNLVSLFDAFRGTILYVSHDIDEALRFCDRIAAVEAGHIMEMGMGEDSVNRPQSQAGIENFRAAKTPRRSSAWTRAAYGCRSGALRWKTAARRARRREAPLACARFSSSAPMGRGATASACASTV
ncbi:MAG: ATP-binding cassette domain-containing protein [Senegalimassilia faecalis]